MDKPVRWTTNGPGAHQKLTLKEPYTYSSKMI